MDRYPINLKNPHPRYIKKAQKLLMNGELVSYPNDVNYGICCLLASTTGVKNLNNLTTRLEKNKLHTMICRDFSELSSYAVLKNDTFKMMKKIMPGPYTVVLEAKNLVPRACQTKRKTIGVRMIKSDVVDSLLQGLEGPLLNFTALPYSHENLEDVDQIEKLYSSTVAMILDAGQIPSYRTTVIDCTGREPLLLRQGLGDSSDLGLSYQHP